MQEANYNCNNASPSGSSIAILMWIKGQLRKDHGSVPQIKAIAWIKEQLGIRSSGNQKIFIDKLIDSGVAPILCEILGSSDGDIFTSILDIVVQLRSSVNFYKYELAKKAVRSIFRVTYFLTKNVVKYANTLSSVAYTVYCILDGATAFDYCITRIYELDKIIRLLNQLQPTKSPKYVLRQSTGKLLCLVLNIKNLQCSEKTRCALSTAFSDSLSSVTAIVERHKARKDDRLLRNFMAITCAICAAGIRFWNDDNRKIGSLNEETSEPFFATQILKTMIDTVIPLFKVIEFSQEELQANLDNFVGCLDYLIQLKCCADNELQKLFVRQGYLTFLLGIESTDRIRDSIISMVAEVIAMLSIDQSMESLVELRNYIYVGLVNLPSQIDNFDLILETDGITSDALAILMYHHYLGTKECSLLSLPRMISKVLLVKEDDIIVLKSVWFLFAMTSLQHPDAQSVNRYCEAAQHLAVLLKKIGIGKCYTHHLAIVDHSFTTEEFPDSLKREVFQWWSFFHKKDK